MYFVSDYYSYLSQYSQSRGMLIQMAHVFKEKSVIPILFAIANTSIEKSKLDKS